MTMLGTFTFGMAAATSGAITAIAPTTITLLNERSAMPGP